MGALPLRAIALELGGQLDTQPAAVTGQESKVIEGTYTFTSTPEGGGQTTDHFVYRDACFERSSFEGCSHLAELSMQVAQASCSWFDQKTDPYGDNVEEADRNILAMLTAMGFADVEANGYYRADTLPNSMGVAVGQRAIVAEGETYTLLVVAPRSGGYKREWVGNTTVGTGDIHQGFKEARDEVLRFVKAYVQKHGIEGKLKLWVAGHSRGAAVSNLVAGFFAAGGAAYLGDSVSVTPQDVYCYANATPATIKDGAKASEVLSVGGARGGAYQKDTPGEAFTSSAQGTVDLSDTSVYGGIRNYISAVDAVPLLPPSTWGFARFGTDLLAGEGAVGYDDMLAQLATLSPAVHQAYLNGADPRSLEWVTIDLLRCDLKNMSLAKLPYLSAKGTGDGSAQELLARRLAGLTTNAPTNAQYVGANYQSVLQAAVGMAMLVNNRVVDGGLAGIPALDQDSSLAKGALLGYLAYASRRLQAEGRASSDAEAAALVLDDLLGHLSGTEVQTKNVDALLETLGKTLADNDDTPLVTSLYDVMAHGVPDANVNLLLGMAKLFAPGMSAALEPSAELTQEAVSEYGAQLAASAEDPRAELQAALPHFFRALAYGPEQGSEASKSMGSAREARLFVMYMLAFIVPPEALGVNSQGTVDGSAPVAKLIDALLDKYMPKKDASGNVAGAYESFDEAADTMLAQGLGAITSPLVAGAAKAYGDDYANELAGYLQVLAEHPLELRSLVCDGLFTVAGQPYSTTYNLAVASTLLKSYGIFVLNHYGETYLCWARAASKATPDSGGHELGGAMYRLYNANSGEHFYTASQAERDALEKAGWSFEGVAWTAPRKSATPVWRLYNGNEPLGDHHYTTDKGEYDALVSQGWTGEGIGWYSDDAKGTKLLRLYNPNAYPSGKTGAHHYTTSEEESAALIALGWQLEDVAWYGVGE